jgi:CBS domain containing-hemolysin-like protein
MEGSILEYALKILVVILLVLANGFFVASEFALVGVRRTRIQTLARAGHKGAQRVERVLNHLDAYISATQLGITLASLALGWVGEETVSHLVEPLLSPLLSETALALASGTISVAIAFTIITVLHIVLGELAPKTLALERAERVAMIVALPMEIFYRAFKAPIWLLNKAGNVVVRMLGLKASAEHAGGVYTEEELRHLVDISHKSGHLNEGERELLHNVFEFAAETVRDCMIPRTEVVAAAAEMPIERVVELIRSSEFSRIPVYEESLDQILGVVHAREVLSAALEGQEATARDLARRTIFVPPGAQLDQVLTRMKRSGHHLAIVVDEHGGLEGIVTLEDIIEELVGEILDEFDENVDDPVALQSDGSYLIDAAIPIRALNRRLGLKIPESNQYATLAGYLLAEAGTIPRQGAEVVADNNRFVVENVRRNRVVTVRLFVASPTDQPAEVKS